eukprot:1317444-Amorphochlora_amoeboformis.AAC.2
MAVNLFRSVNVGSDDVSLQVLREKVEKVIDYTLRHPSRGRKCALCFPSTTQNQNQIIALLLNSNPSPRIRSPVCKNCSRLPPPVQAVFSSAQASSRSVPPPEPMRSHRDARGHPISLAPPRCSPSFAIPIGGLVSMSYICASARGRRAKNRRPAAFTHARAPPASPP